jgi:MFS family permease
MATDLATTTSAPLSDRQIQRGLRLNLFAGSFGMIWVAVAMNMPYVMLLEALGASGMIQGVAATVNQLAIGAQIPGALVVESLRRRKVFWGAGAIIHRLMWFIPAGVAWFMPGNPSAANLIIIVTCLSAVVANATASAWHSWMADLIPENRRGRFWASRQVWTMSAFLVGIGMAGYALDHLPSRPDGGPMVGFAVVFAIATVFGIADILIHLGVPEPMPRRVLNPRRILSRLISPLQHPSFRRLALSMGLWVLACGVIGPFSMLYLKRTFGASYTELSIITIAGSVSTVIAGLVAGYLIDRVGPRAVGAIMMVLGPCFGLVWFLLTHAQVTLHIPFGPTLVTSQAVLLITLSSLLSAGLYSCVGLAHLTMLGAIAPKRGRTLAMALHWTLIGVMGAAGPLLGGFIVDHFPADGLSWRLFGQTRVHFIHPLVLIHVGVCWLLALPVFMSVRMRREPMGVLEAFDRIVLVNPLRFASGIYHARVMTAPVSRNRRAKAVEAVGEAGAEIALADVESKLDDPSIDVREAAVHSLGMLGSPEAIDALRRTIADPQSDLTVQAVRALRRCASPRVVPDLIPLLHHENVELVRETARTLGAAHDERAIDPLMDLLHTTRHNPVAMAAAEALGRLGDVTAVYGILPRMRTTPHPVLRRAFAVSAGDLMGAPDRFYRVLTLEDESHGSGVADLLHSLRTTIQRIDESEGYPFGDSLDRLIVELDTAYDRRDLRACARIAFRLASLLASLRYGVQPAGDNTFAFLANLETLDTRFAAGAWYLAILDGAFDRAQTSATLNAVRELIEIQLAIFVLSSWSEAIHSRAAPDSHHHAHPMPIQPGQTSFN